MALGAFFALSTAALTSLQGLLLGPLLRLLTGGEFSSRTPRWPSGPLWLALTSGSWSLGHRAILLTLIVTATGRAVFAVAEASVWASMTERVAVALRLRLLRAILYAPSDALDLLSPGVLAARLCHDVDDAARAATSVTAALVRDGLTVLLLAAVALSLSPSLFLLTALTWPVVAYGLRIGARRQGSGAMGAMHHRDRLAAWASGLSASIQAIRLMNLRAYVSAEVHLTAESYGASELKRARSAAMTSALTELTAALALLATLHALDPLPAESLDRTLAFFYAVFMAYRPLKGLGTLQVTAASGAQALAAINSLPCPPSPSPEGLAAKTLAVGDLRVMRGDHEVVLRGRHALTPGTITAITGASGAGKTSLLDALSGHRPSFGEILFDNEALDGRELRAGFASQDASLLPTSLMANLSAGPERWVQAREMLSSLGLGPWLERLPQGFLTVLGPGGLSPSVGERKRLGVARALLYPSAMVMLDEPTEALDAEAAAKVRSVLRAEANRGRTVLVVTHDPALSALSDTVIELTGT